MRVDHTLTGLAIEPFALAIDEPQQLSVGEQNWLACQLMHVRQHWFKRGKAPHVFHRSEFHRRVTYEPAAADSDLYLRAANRQEV